MMAVLQDIYPNYSTKLYIVNLPSYLGWFVRFVKGFLCEMVQRKIELVGGLINDIRDEDIQGEYLGAFTQIRSAVVNLIAKYTTDGFCEETEGLLALYKGLIQQFEEEYEL